MTRLRNWPAFSARGTAFIITLAALGCPASPAGGPDASVASTTDGSVPLIDGGQPDAALPRDGGRSDASIPDASLADAGMRDAGPRDAGNMSDAAAPPDAAMGDANATWRSTLYPENWQAGMADSEGRALQDYSYAGYRNGEQPPSPSTPGVSVMDHGADPSGTADSTAAVQAAVDAVSMTGGVVLVPAGSYRLDGDVRITSSNVVLRGDGPGQTMLRFTRAGPSNTAHITVGTGGSFGLDHPLAADAARFDRTLLVADASDLAVGMDVAVGFVITPEFVEAHGMTGTWQAFNGTWQPFYLRTIASVDTSVTPHVVTLDVPLRDPVLLRDSASIRPQLGVIHDVGVESLSISNVVTRAQAWSIDQVHALALDGVTDAWVRNVHSFGATGGDHLQSGGVMVRLSKRVTVADSRMERAQNRGSGGNGYLFELRQSSEVLLADDVAVAGRHNFIQNWGFGTTGCVLLRCVSRDGRSLGGDWDPIGLPGMSETHHSLATANLLDGCTLDDGFNAGNRGTESTGAGHTARENVLWNARGTGVIRSLQHGHGYVIGTRGVQVVTALSTVSFGFSGQGTAPEDMVEGAGEGATLVPASLYEDQRQRRLAP